jgi:hypothetical protein
MGWKDVLADIAAAIKDPLGRYYELEKQHGNPDPEKRPLWLMTDKPWDNPKVTGRPVKILPQVVRIPPLDSLVHDKQYFDAVEASPLHGGLLDGLRDYYV